VALLFSSEAVAERCQRGEEPLDAEAKYTVLLEAATSSVTENTSPRVIVICEVSSKPSYQSKPRL
jgi:hypothetical protein